MWPVGVDAVPVQVRIAAGLERVEERRHALGEVGVRPQPRTGREHAVVRRRRERRRVHDRRLHAGGRETLVQRVAGPEHPRVALQRVRPRVGPRVEDRRHDVAERRLVDVPLVQPVLADRAARVHRRHVRGGRRRELRRQLRDLQPPQERDGRRGARGSGGRTRRAARRRRASARRSRAGARRQEGYRRRSGSPHASGLVRNIGGSPGGLPEPDEILDESTSVRAWTSTTRPSWPSTARRSAAGSPIMRRRRRGARTWASGASGSASWRRRAWPR